jgi:DNA-binding GntR family transcriptional regulator
MKKTAVEADDTKSAGAGPRAQAVHRALRRAILDQALPPGSKLPEDAIGERLGVSRTLVREALVRLSEVGLVEMAPNKGATVARPSLEDGWNIHTTRVALERLVVDLLASKLTAEQEQKLLAHIDAEDAASHQPREAISVRLAGEFHTLLASMTHNETLVRFIDELVARNSLILSMYARPHSAECGIAEHREIVAAIKTGDRAKASALMAEHLNSITSRALMPKEGSDIHDVLKGYAVAEGLTP